MIPILGAIAAPIVSSLIQGVFQNQPPPPPPPATDAAGFSDQLTSEIRNQNQNEPAKRATTIQSLIALQRSLGSLTPEQQEILGKGLLNQKVQLQDGRGNSVIGVVARVWTQNGQTYLDVNNRSYSLTSVRGLLPGTTQP